MKCPKCGHEFIPPVRLTPEYQETTITLAKALLESPKWRSNEIWELIRTLPGEGWNYHTPRRYLLEHRGLIRDPAFAGKRGGHLRWAIDRGVLEVIAAGQFELFDTPAIHGS